MMTVYRQTAVRLNKRLFTSDSWYESVSKVSQSEKRCYSTKYISHSEYCMDQVRKFDYENFLSTLLLPKECRAAVFAIRAFNVEVAQIRDIVSDKTIGLMRIQFQKDAIEGIYKDSPPNTPVSLELSRALKKHKLSKRWMMRILEARQENMNGQSFFKIEELEEYAEKSVSSINYLILESLGVEDVNADHAASHIGKAQGLTTTLRATPYHANRGHCYLPTQPMLTHGVSQEDVFRGCEEQRMKDLAYDIASSAHQHLQMARDMRASVPKIAYPAYLSTVSVEAYLKSLQQADFNLFDGRLQQRNSWLPLSLWLQKRKKTY